MGTFSRTPRRTSRSKWALTFSSQWMGTAAALCAATGFAFGSMVSRRGGPAIMGRGWWVQVLNVDPLNISRRCCSKMPLFSSVAGTGRGKGPDGGKERVGHPHLRTSTVGTSSGRCGSGMLDTAPAEVDGNIGGMRPRSAHFPTQE